MPFHEGRSAGRSTTRLIQWLGELPKPVGLMASNDDFALSISELCRIHGIQVPEEVAILGVDNDEVICELSSPPLSSISISTQRAGYEAAELLDRLMHGKPSGQMVVVRPSHVVGRQSTDFTAVDDLEVAAALRFIRQNSHRIIQVSDVAKAVSLSRRSLSDRFMQRLGHTIAAEINRRRVDQIMRLLATSQRSIAEIADDMGYFSDKHIARYFHRQTGMTPRAYRRKFGPR